MTSTAATLKSQGNDRRYSQVREEGDTCGGAIEIIARGVPAVWANRSLINSRQQ